MLPRSARLSSCSVLQEVSTCKFESLTGLMNTGIGYGMVFLPTYIHVSTYFEKKRALATGIAVAGCGAGTFAMAPVWSTALSSEDKRAFLV